MELYSVAGLHVLGTQGTADVWRLLQVNVKSRLGPRSPRVRLPQREALPWTAPQVWHDLDQPAGMCCVQQSAVPSCCRQGQARYNLSGASGAVQYTGSDKSHLVLELIGSHSKARWPHALYLSDGLTYHRIIFNGKQVAHWLKLEPHEALYCMVTDRKKVRLMCNASPAALDACHHALSKDVCCGWSALTFLCSVAIM